jgi:WD40 repeat protein
MVAQLSPRVIPGPAIAENGGSLDWGNSRLVAYAAQSTVVVVDPTTVQLLQTLAEHTAAVSRVRWSIKSARMPLPTLASGDVKGNILIWDVTDAQVIVSLAGPGAVASAHPPHLAGS